MHAWEREASGVKIHFRFAGGIGLLAGVSFARSLCLVASGMLLYTAIVSPGYFAQKGR